MTPVEQFLHEIGKGSLQTKGKKMFTISTSLAEPPFVLRQIDGRIG